MNLSCMFELEANGCVPDRQGLNDFHCPHCNSTLSKSSYYHHRSLYFRDDVWEIKKDTKAKEMTQNHSENCREIFVAESEPKVDAVPLQISEDFHSEEIPCIDNEDIEESTNTEIWMDDSDPEGDFENSTPGGDIQFIFIQKIIILLLNWQSRFYISDNAISILLALVKYIFLVIQNFCKSDVINTLVEQFPMSLSKAKEMVNLKDNFICKFVCCSKCCTLYRYEDCLSAIDLKKCSFVKFPKHTQERFREPCNEILMKKLVSVTGKKNYLYPKKVYSYLPIRNSLQNLLQRNEIFECLIKGPEKSQIEDVMMDICDGRFWKEFRFKDGSYYFNNPRHLGVMLNVDWFQPFSNVEHSVGVIYLAVLNLPREVRYKKENILIVGVIPGPKEPEGNINSFLRPLVNELNLFWNGMELREKNQSRRYRIALLCVSSDLPATRKCCGFLSYHALKGCSKCLKLFPRNGLEKADFSGYNFEEWIPRKKEDHVKFAKLQKNATTKTEKQQIEREYGVRYSELFKLPYYDPIRCHLVDPMHNMILGVTKHFFVTMVELGKITREKIDLMDEAIRQLQIPTQAGRFPTSLHYYKSFKAEEWKVWLLYLSLFSFRNVLSRKYYNVWQVFVRGARILLVTDISILEVENANLLFGLYCRKFEEVVGRAYCTPNMHMLLHLKDCVLDFGPVHGFWCYAFERQNGILGSYNTNNRSITIQLMKKFVEGNIFSSSFEKLFDDTEIKFLREKNLALPDVIKSNFQLFALLRRTHEISKGNIVMDYEVLSIRSILRLHDFEKEEILNILRKIFGNSVVSITSFVNEFRRLNFGNDIFVSDKYREGSSPNKYVMARYDLKDVIRPAIIKCMFEVKTQIKLPTGRIETVNIPFLKVSFMKEHPLKNYYGVNCPMLIWNSTYENAENGTFIPMTCLVKRCVVAKVCESFRQIPTMIPGQCYSGRDVVYFITH